MPLTSLLSSTELGLLCLGGFVLFHSSGRPVSQSISCGICLAMMYLSFVFQAAFLVGVPALSFPLELAALGFAGWTLLKGRQSLKAFWSAIVNFVRTQRVIASLLLTAWIYLGLQAFLLPPGNDDSMTCNLARVLLFQREHTLFLDRVTTFRQVAFPVGADILTHLFLRFRTDYGVALFSFFSYVAIVTGTYALARRYTKAQIALIASIIVASFPELVYQATSTKNDIVAAAAGMFTLLIAHELWERPAFSRVLLFILAILFGVSAKITFPAFALPFCFIFGFELLRKHGLKTWKQMICTYRWHAVSAFAPVFVLSQVWLFAYNKLQWGGWTGPSEAQFETLQWDGISGGMANLIRYLLQSFDCMSPVDNIFQAMLGYRPSEAVERIYLAIVHPIFGDLGIASCCGTFHMSRLFASAGRWVCHEDLAWFGPFGFFLVIPAIVYALFESCRPLRAVAISLSGFLVITSLALGWTPFNNRYFSLLFGLSGALVACFLHRIKPGRITVRAISLVSIFILFYAATYNEQKPLLTTHWVGKWPRDIAKNSIWARTRLGRDRLYYAKRYYKDDRLIRFQQLVPAGARVAMLVEDPKMSCPWVYPYLLMNPAVKFIPATPSQQTDGAIRADYSLLLDSELRNSTTAQGEVVWEPEKNNKRVFEGTLQRTASYAVSELHPDTPE